MPKDSIRLFPIKYNELERILMCTYVPKRENPADGTTKDLNAARVDSGSW